MTMMPEPKPKLMGDFAPPIRSEAEYEARLAEDCRMILESRPNDPPRSPESMPQPGDDPRYTDSGPIDLGDEESDREIEEMYKELYGDASA